MKPPLIDTPQQVEKKLELLMNMLDIQVALKILSSVDITPVDRASEKWKKIEESISSTHASTHQNFTMEVMDLFSLEKEAEAKKFKDCGNTKLLYHGSRLSNWAGILSQGLKIAPPEAPVTGYMFGKG